MKLNRRRLTDKRRIRLLNDLNLLRCGVSPPTDYTHSVSYSEARYTFYFIHYKVKRNSSTPPGYPSYLYKIYFHGRRGLLVPIKNIHFCTVKTKEQDLIFECQLMCELMIDLNVTSPNDIELGLERYLLNSMLNKEIHDVPRSIRTYMNRRSALINVAASLPYGLRLTVQH